jgi:hypothetical protein
MKVKIKNKVIGVGYSYEPNEVVEVSDERAEYLIKNEIAELVEDVEAEKNEDNKSVKSKPTK